MELRITSRRSYTYYQQTPHGKYRIGVSDETVTVDDRDVDFMLSTGKFARLDSHQPQEVIDAPDDDVLEANEIEDDFMPDLDAMTKDDLMAYADEHGIEYTTRMTKAEIRAVIEEHNRGA